MPLTEKDLQVILDALNRYIEQVGKSSAPQNRSTQPQKKGSGDKGNNAKDGAQDGKIKVAGADIAGASDVSETIADALRSIEKKIAANRAANEVSRDIMEDSLVKIETQSMTSAHSRIKVDTSYFTHTSVTPNQTIIYNGVYKSVEGVSKRISRSLEDALKEYSMGGQYKKLAFGPDFDVTDAYRPDGRFFVRNKLPEDLPEIAVAVLVDQSGSMKGPRIKAAMTMAILVDDFCRRLNIPVLIAGHNVRRRGACNYTVYTDFDRVKDSAKCNLTRLSDCGGCNRDGLAVSITAGLLQKRPEPVKLLFIISDGQPNDNRYGGELAVKDIQSIITPYKRKGIAVFAAAIGDDKEQVREIYQDSYLDITDLNALPKAIVKILKKQIMAHL